MKKWILLVTAIFALLAINVETKKLMCAETGKADFAQVIPYSTIPGKKGTSGVKGLKGEPARITKQDLDKSESKKYCTLLLVVIIKLLALLVLLTASPKFEAY